MLQNYRQGAVSNRDFFFWQFTQAEWGDSVTYVAGTRVELDFVFGPKRISFHTGLVYVKTRSEVSVLYPAGLMCAVHVCNAVSRIQNQFLTSFNQKV
jgi:hypothetical protein